MSLKFQITGDNSNFLESLIGARNGVRTAAQDIEKSGLDIEDVFKRIAAAAGIAFSLDQAKNFVGKVMSVRGQFQQLEIAFGTMLQSSEKASALMKQLVDTAATTPFDLAGVAEGAKQLLAYGIAAEDVNETITRLGDIAAGLSIPLGDLVYLYGTTMTQGKMFTMDLRQFMGRGIPMADELAKQFGVAKEEVAGLVTAGKVGADAVKAAIWSMTDEGSRFGGLMKAQSASITGQISNIEDAFDSMINDIGKSSEGVINKGLSAVSSLIENYKDVGVALASIATAYGTYKAALVAVSVVEKTNMALLRQAVLEKNLAAAANVTLSNSEALAAARGKMFALVQQNVINTLKGAGAALANPYVLLATAVGTAVFAVYKLATSQTELEKARTKLKEATDENNASMAAEGVKIDSLFARLKAAKKGTEEYKEAKGAILSQYGDYLKGMSKEVSSLEDVAAAYKKIKEEAIKAAKARAMTSFTEEAASDYGKAIAGARKDLNKALQKQYGGKKAADGTSLAETYYWKIVPVLEGEKDITSDIEKILKPMDKLLVSSGSSVTGNTGTSATTVNDARTAINKAKKSRKVYDKVMEEARKEFGEAPAQKEDKGGKPKEVVKNKKYWEDYLKEQRGLLDAMTEAQLKTKEAAKIRENIKKANAKIKKLYSVGQGGGTKAGSKSGAGNLKELKDDIGTERLRAAQELEQKVTDARIAAMDDGEEKISKLREQQNKEEIDAIEKQKDAAVKEYVEQEKKIYEAKGGKKFDKSSVDTSAIVKQYDELIRLKKEEQSKALGQEALQSMRDFLKEYGSFEQQRLATTEEYEEKIAKAQTQGEKLSLKKERDQRLGSLEYDNIASGIDWRALFSGVGTLSKEMMQPMMDKLMAYTKTAEYFNADSQTQKSVADLIQELRQYLGTDQSMTWQSLGTATENFVSAVGQYNQAVENERASVQKLAQAKSDLKAGKISKETFNEIKSETDRFGEAARTAKDKMEKFATALNDTSEQVGNYTSALTAALNKAKGWKDVEGFNGIQQSVGQIDALKGAIDSVLPTMSEGVGKTVSEGLSSVIGSGLSSLGSGLSSVLSSGLGQAIGFVAQIPKLILNIVSGIKNFVTGVLNAITEIISLRWIDDLVNSILGAVGNLIDAIFDLPENLYKVLSSIVVNGVGGLLNTVLGRIGNILSFGALDSGGPADWFTNSNSKKVADTIDRLTEENKVLEQAIEDLTSEMENARGAAAIDISSRAKDLQQQTIENYKEAAQAQAGYHSAHHSWNYYWGGYDQEQKERLSKQIGREWNGDIWDLSPEEMKVLRSNVDMWNQIVNTGKGGYGDRVADKLNDYIDQAGKLEDITDKLYENLTTTTEENVFDDFLNSLYELADGSEDVFDDIADAWQKMVNKMVVNNLIGNKFQEKLKKWYEELAKLNEAKTAEGSNMSDEVYRARLEALKAEYNDMVKDAQSEIGALRDAGVIKTTDSYSQEASSKGFQSMGQDTAEELNGRFTALQISGDTIAQQAVQMYGQMIAMTDIQTSSNNCLIEIRNMMITANSYLDDVAKYSKKIYLDFGDKLDKVVKSTERL